MSNLILRFLGDRRGNIAVLFALLALPMLAMVGVAIDYNRASNARTKLAASLDAGLLALARSPNMSEGAAKSFLIDYVSAELEGTGFEDAWQLTGFEQTDQWVKASATSDVETAMLGLLSFPTIPVGASAEVVREQKRVELALVLDNTGSMNSSNKIGALRDAAGALVDIMYAGAGSADKVKIALVPFVTGVNIKAEDAFSMDWMDTEAKSKYHGINFDEIATTTGRGKKAVTTFSRVNHFDLYDQMVAKNKSRYPSWQGWKGCVEARPEPYDTDDTPPSRVVPDTLWVPWFWPDEPDTAGRNYTGGNGFANDFMDDDVSGTNNAEARQKNYLKYSQTAVRNSSSIRETASDTSGPNKSCAQPILPLTSDKARLKADINAMRAWNNSGTNIAQGLAWGWRVLSPGEPFTEGVPYSQEDTLKAIVLLTDGENVVVNQNNTLNYSDYNSYNYLGVDRLDTTSPSTAASRINAKVTALCNSIKGLDIRIYTILFDLNSSSLRTLFRNCATATSMYFDNPSSSELKGVFQTIAYDLSNLRLSK